MLSYSYQAFKPPGGAGSSGSPSLLWDQTVPTINVVKGTSGSLGSLITTNLTGDPNLLFEWDSGTALPAGFHLNDDGTYSVSPSTSTGVTAGVKFRATGVDDWTERSAGAQKAARLSTAAEVALEASGGYVFVDGQEDHWSLDTTTPVDGGSSLKCNVLNADGTSSGELRIPFGVNVVNGDTVWFSVRVYAPPEFCYQAWDTIDASSTGHKLLIMSNTSGSNQDFEVTIQISDNNNMIQGYYDGALFIHFDSPLATACNGSDLNRQNQITNAKTLTGLNPDTGASWSACELALGANGDLYSAKSQADFALGAGQPLEGGVRQRPNVWQTLTGRIIVGHYDTADSQFTLWEADNKKPYVKVIDWTGMNLRSGGPLNGIWLLPYTTRRVAGGKKITGTTGLITGVTLHTCGLGTATGAGSLEYNATTQRFRWHAAGGTYGTARGFSRVNQKLLLNVFDSVGSGSRTGSYVAFTVNDDLLPQSGTITDTVTIATNRPDTRIHYRDLIIKTGLTNSINAIGGFVPS